MVKNEGGPGRRSVSEGGFTLIEFMIAAAITAAVLGGTVMLATQLQQAYSYQLDDTTVEEEARFALDWIGQTLRNAGTNPYDIASLTTSCPGTGMFGDATGTQAHASGIQMDPNGNGTDDDIRIHADVNPPNGLLGSLTGLGSCSDLATGEDVTIALDADDKVITRQDHTVDDAPVPMTEPIFTRADAAPALLFTCLDSSRNATTNPNLVTYVQVQVTGQSKARNPITGAYTESTLQTEVRLRTR